MSRSILCVFIVLFFYCIDSYSQILRFSGGINNTWMDGDQFDTPCLTYTGSIGYDYLFDRDYRDWFYLSSEIGYIKRDGTDALNGERLSRNYLHLNTLFKVRYSFENIMLFAGMGPCVDYWVITGGQDKKTVFGIRPEIGLSYPLGDRVSLYFTTAYLRSLSGIMIEGEVLNNNSLMLTIGIGYRVKKKKINYWHYSNL